MRKFPTSLVRENKWAAADCGFCWSVRLQQMFMVRKNYPLGTHNGLLLLQFLGIRVHFFHTDLSMILEIENYDRQPLIFPLGYFVRTTDLHKIGVAYVPLLLRCLKATEKHDENVSFCGKLQIHYSIILIVAEFSNCFYMASTFQSARYWKLRQFYEDLLQGQKVPRGQ